MENKPKIMIIDDELNTREKTYANVLSAKFELVFIRNAGELFSSINSVDVAGYVVDIVLNEWQNAKKKPQELIPVLEAIGKDKPVFLVSRHYDTLLKNNELTPTINEVLGKGFLLSSFFVWQDFQREEHDKTQDNSQNINTYSIENSIMFFLLKYQPIVRKAADVGVICALGEELRPFLDNLEKPETASLGNVHYTKGTLTTISGKEIRIVAAQQQEMGTVDAAIISTLLTREFCLKHLIMTGVCGGRDSKAEIGDIIVPHEINAFQKGKITNRGLQLDVGVAVSNNNQKQIFENRCDGVIKDVYKRSLEAFFDSSSEIAGRKPGIRFDEMGCGENVISKSGEIDKIAKEIKKPKLCAIDMESFAIFRLAEFLDVKTLVIKSVMDLTKNKSDKHKAYAAFVASNFVAEVLRREIYKV